MSRDSALIWLQVACGLTILTGLVAALASHPAGSGSWLLLFDLLAWPVDGQPAAFAPETFATNAVLGGVMIGWGVLMLQLVRGPLAGRDLPAAGATARMITIGLGAWFVIDTSGSFAAGLPGNAVLNAGFLLLFLPPLLRLLRES